MRNIGMTEILIIAGILLLLFGGKKIPELMRGLGKGVSEFKKGTSDTTAEEDTDRAREVAKEPAPTTKA